MVDIPAAEATPAAVDITANPKARTSCSKAVRRQSPGMACRKARHSCFAANGTIHSVDEGLQTPSEFFTAVRTPDYPDRGDRSRVRIYSCVSWLGLTPQP